MKKQLFLLILFVCCFFATDAQIITTIAGIGTGSYSGDSSLAINAGLSGPYAVALDGLGNYYIADGYNNRIRKVSAAGIITTVVGTGTSGYNGDGIVATAAEIYHPNGMAFDNTGNLYFADPFNNRIRKVSAATGIITTVAGNGTLGYNGDNMPADSAELNDPHGVCVDAAGNLYITDFSNHRIRKVSTSGVITTIAGNGSAGNTGEGGLATDAQIDGPYGIVTDNSGNVYFADIYENVVRKIDASGFISTFAGTGSATGPVGDNGSADSARLEGPAGLAKDDWGNIYIGNVADARVRRVSITSGIITTVAGNGTIGESGDNGLATLAEITSPTGLAIDPAGNLYIADFGNQRIRYVTTTEGVNRVNNVAAQLFIYPNPSHGSFIVNIAADEKEQAKIMITNMLEQQLQQWEMLTNKSVLIPFNEPAGMYILSATTKHNTWSEKVIVKE